MNSDERRVVRNALGAIEDELRQRRAVDSEILNRLDRLIKLAGGTDARLQALREDHDTFVEYANERFRPIPR